MGRAFPAAFMRFRPPGASMIIKKQKSPAIIMLRNILWIWKWPTPAACATSTALIGCAGTPALTWRGADGRHVPDKPARQAVLFP